VETLEIEDPFLVYHPTCTERVPAQEELEDVEIEAEIKICAIDADKLPCRNAGNI